ncbi:MAG: quinone-dependent dihydroorotate dehydrogenase [Bacteroidales bacterium]|nr:quinone-dependent dihydroorotate dehydrogenase [Bacteroidales bacterium]
MYKQLIRPWLFRMNPERAHNFTLRVLDFVGKIPLASYLVRLAYKRHTPELARNVFGLEFANPVGLAAGLDKNGEHCTPLSWFGFSFIEIGSLTPEPQDGNPKPRLFRLPKDRALVNRMGINNKGVLNAIRHLQADRPRTIIAASIAKNTSSTSDADAVEDYKKAFSLLYDFVDMFTVNVSCPNVEGLQTLQDVSYLSDIIDPLLELRICYDSFKPILVKVSPDIQFDELDEILKYCMVSGVDGIVAGNTTRSRDGLKTKEKRIEKIGKGGLSGAPLFARSLAMVRHIHEFTKGRLPIVACGGIMSPGEAAEMLQAGASLIEIYTGFIYEGPSLVKRINKHLCRLQHPAEKKQP